MNVKASSINAPTHIGDRTQSQLQVMFPVSLSVTNIKVKAVNNPIFILFSLKLPSVPLPKDTLWLHQGCY